MPQIDMKVKKFEVFAVFGAISVNFPKHLVLTFKTIDSVMKKRAVHYNCCREHCSVLLQKLSRMIPKK